MTGSSADAVGFGSSVPWGAVFGGCGLGLRIVGGCGGVGESPWVRVRSWSDRREGLLLVVFGALG